MAVPTQVRALSLAVLLLIAAGACSSTRNLLGSPWTFDFGSARSLALERDAPLLILVAENGAEGRRILARPEINGSLKSMAPEFVRCLVTREREPDRRYLAQYGVFRAPAVVVVRVDGTYHRRTGSIDVAALNELIIAARDPGSVPVVDPFLLRSRCYAWRTDFARAVEEARAEEKNLLVVYDRRWTRDRRKLIELLERPEVMRRLQDAVPVRARTVSPWTKRYITAFGVLDLPALVLVDPRGSYDVLERPTDYEMVVRFVDGFATRPMSSHTRSKESATEGTR